MAKRKLKNSKVAQISWKAIGIITVVLFLIVTVSFALSIKNDWEYVFGRTAQAQAMEYEIEEEQPTLALYSEETETPEETPDEETDAPEQSEEEKTSVGDYIDQKGEDISNLIKSETGIAISGGAVLIGLALIFLLKK